MEVTHQLSLTPEQLAAIHSGGGYVRCQDPVTHVQYQLIQCNPTTLDDAYIREKLGEAQQDVERGDESEWNAAELLNECRKLWDAEKSGE